MHTSRCGPGTRSKVSVQGSEQMPQSNKAGSYSLLSIVTFSRAHPSLDGAATAIDKPRLLPEPSEQWQIDILSVARELRESRATLSQEIRRFVAGPVDGGSRGPASDAAAMSEANRDHATTPPVRSPPARRAPESFRYLSCILRKGGVCGD